MTLEERLKKHSECFSSMVELIPPRIYCLTDTEHNPTDGKYFHNKKRKAPKQEVKEATKKAKKLKLDPENQKSVEELRKEVLKREDSSVEDGEKEVKSKFSVEGVRSASLSELRERLQKKIEEFRQKRGTKDEQLEVKDQKREQRNKKKKAKDKQEQKKKSLKQVTGGTDGGHKKASMLDEEGRIVFSKFDFSTPTADHNKQSKKKDYKRLLKKAEAAQEKLKEIKASDDMKGQELEETISWRRALDMAKGQKRKDDPALLKKTIKNVEKKKQRSKKQWEQRLKAEEQSKKKRQELRQKNIKSRVEQKRDKKKGSKKVKSKPKTARKPGF